MESNPSLSKYFGDTERPPGSKFFDEISTDSSAMVQSIYLGDSEVPDTPTPKKRPAPPPPITDQNSHIVPTVSATTAISPPRLPDPSTFFDTIGPELQIAPKPVTIADDLSGALDAVSLSNQPVDIEMDRRRDAWLPNEEAQKTLMKAQSSPKGSFFPDRDVLTMPGLLLEEELKDTLQDAAVRLLGVGAWGNRPSLRADHVSKDESGLRELLRAGFFRSAVNLTGIMLESLGQGIGRLNKPTKHTPRSLQIWLTRFAVLSRIKMYDVLVRESEAFGDMDKPDMFYQFYQESYGNRSGMLVPFSLRLLLAESQANVGKADVALRRLYGILAVIRKMITNLETGRTEDGLGVIENENDKNESIKLWMGRETRVMHSIINCAIVLKDFKLAMCLLNKMAANESSASQKRQVYSALCRLSLQAGHVKAAIGYQSKSAEMRQEICPTPDVREYVDMGLIDVSQGKYQDAYVHFSKAAEQDPTNIMVANNLSVCLLYMGKLKDAIVVLQKVLDSDPERALNENLLVNLATLYELESAKPQEKKLNLLRKLCMYKSDCMPSVLEALKLNL